jgi:hypothetical protein
MSPFLHILSHFRDCECDSQVALPTCTFPSPYLGSDPKVDVIEDGPNTIRTIFERKGKKCKRDLKSKVWAPTMSATIL